MRPNPAKTAPVAAIAMAVAAAAGRSTSIKRWVGESPPISATTAIISRSNRNLMARGYFDRNPGSTPREDLREFFTRAGEVRGVLLVTDKVSGESKGFGCV